MKRLLSEDVEVIGLDEPIGERDESAQQVDLGPMFDQRDCLEEVDDDSDVEDYDEDFDPEAQKHNTLHRFDQGGRFRACHRTNRLDDLGQLLHESEKFRAALSQVGGGHAQFTDPEFPPELSSLVGHSQDFRRNQEMRAFEFQRSSVYFKNRPKVFDDISSEDIIQGALGDCYFLAAVSSIAEHPHRLERLLLSKEHRGDGIFAVALCLNGVWEEVLLDDFAPCTRAGELAFNKSKSDELWVVLLEKAWAKVHGGYLNIEAGLTREALRDLTGASAKTFFLRQNPEEIWGHLMEAERQHFIMTAGSDNLSGGSDAYIQKIGICGSHAYSLLAVYQLKKQGWGFVLSETGQDYDHRVVKVRNPWGKGEWKGDWADSDPRWTADLRSRLGASLDPEDGIFFMGWKDFREYFSDVQICYFHDGFKYSAAKFESQRNEQVFLKVKIDSPGKYYFSVNQRNRRFYRKDAGYKYSKLGWVLGRQENQSASFVASGNKPDKENWDVADCPAGEYYVQVDTPWRSLAKEFSFSVYGAGLTDITRISEEELPPHFLRNVFISKAQIDMKKSKNDFGHRGHGDIMYVSGEKNGWAYMYFKNDSEEDQVKVTLKLGRNGAGVKVLAPHEGPRPSMVVGPHQEDIIVYASNGPRAVSVSMATSFKKVPKQLKKIEEKAPKINQQNHSMKPSNPAKNVQISGKGRDGGNHQTSHRKIIRNPFQNVHNPQNYGHNGSPWRHRNDNNLKPHGGSRNVIRHRSKNRIIWNDQNQNNGHKIPKINDGGVRIRRISNNHSSSKIIRVSKNGSVNKPAKSDQNRRPHRSVRVIRRPSRNPNSRADCTPGQRIAYNHSGDRRVIRPSQSTRRVVHPVLDSNLHRNTQAPRKYIQPSNPSKYIQGGTPNRYVSRSNNQNVYQSGHLKPASYANPFKPVSGNHRNFNPLGPRNMNTRQRAITILDKSLNSSMKPVSSTNNHDIKAKTRNSNIVLNRNLNGENVDIEVRMLHHDDGLALLYSNKSRNLTLHEKVSFKLRNSKIIGRPGNSVQMKLEPGEERLVQIVRTSAKGEFTSSIDQMSYALNPRQIIN